jgi:hypothetical protein
MLKRLRTQLYPDVVIVQLVVFIVMIMDYLGEFSNSFIFGTSGQILLRLPKVLVLFKDLIAFLFILISG